MNYSFDVAVVGGGPIGSTLAYEIAKDGFSVCIIEKKKEIGLPLQCAGIVSKTLKEVNDIPDDMILNRVKGAFIHSLSYNLKVEKNETEAFIIDRIAYDQFLSKRATDYGVKIFNPSKVTHVNTKKGIIKCKKNRKISAKIIVGADGSNSVVSSIFNNKFNYFHGSQFLVETPRLNQDIEIANSNQNILNIGNYNLIKKDEKNNGKENDHTNDFVDIYVNSKTLPGFLWCIPISKNKFRVGIFSNNSYKEQNSIINEFLENNPNFKIYKVIEKYHGKIPIYDKNKKIVHDRVILIGDAASQLKPTTGGGLIIGFDACKIAKKVIEKALKEDEINILKEYEYEFKKKYSKELSYQIKVQKTIENLSDEDLDFMFIKLKEKNAEKIISKYGDMDKQSILVKEFIKRGLIFSILPKMLFRKISAIWSF